MNKPLVLFALAAFGLGAGMPAQADPPPWAPAHGYRAKQAEVREYKYVYYPAQQVYYAPATRSWFWLSGGNWQVGVNLPTQFRVSVGDSVPVMLHSDRPYVEHVYVEERYGRPWREKHHGRGHDRDDDDHDRDHDRGHGHGRDR